jgi:hypothetical protein
MRLIVLAALWVVLLLELSAVLHLAPLLVTTEKQQGGAQH